MKRIIMMVLKNILFVPWGWFMLNKYAANVERYTEGERYALLKKIDHKANVGGNITVKSYGVENIPNENGFMFYPNHQGLYDVLAILEACPTPFSVVAKKEVGNVPFLRQVFACMKAYIMDREDIRQSMQIILNVTKEVKKAMLKQWAEENILTLAQTIAVGDGANDLPMILTAGIGIAFNAKPIVREQAPYQIDQADLYQVVSLLEKIESED